MNNYLDIAKQALKQLQVQGREIGSKNYEFNEFNETAAPHDDKIQANYTRGEYDRVYPGDTAEEAEFAEIERLVHQRGVCLTWCEVLGDYIAFHRDDIDPATIPQDFICYREDELREIFGEDKPDIAVGVLKLIHAAKKTGAKVTQPPPTQR